MIIIKTAWKNIWRKKITSFVVLLAIVSGLCCGLLAAAIITGFVKQIVDSVVYLETSHIVMQADSFNINHDIYYYMQDSDKLTQEINALGSVEVSCNRLKIPGYISSAHGSKGVKLIGVTPDEEIKVFDLHAMISESKGSFFSDGISHPIVIGRALSNSLNVELNSRLVATFQSVDGDLVSSMFRVAGIFEVENYIFERTTIFVLKDELAYLSGLDPQSSHEIAIKISGSLSDIKNTMVDLADKFPEYSFLAWYDIRPEIGIVYSYTSWINTILIGIILLALSFGILNNMLMAILERKYEIGMLRAIGMNEKKVFVMVMLETLFLVLTGAFISIIISWVLLQWLGETGIDMRTPSSSISDMNISAERVFPFLEMHQYIKMTIMVIITGILSAIYPMKQILKTNPADALRRLN